MDRQEISAEVIADPSHQRAHENTRSALDRHRPYHSIVRRNILDQLETITRESFKKRPLKPSIASKAKASPKKYAMPSENKLDDAQGAYYFSYSKLSSPTKSFRSHDSRGYAASRISTRSDMSADVRWEGSQSSFAPSMADNLSEMNDDQGSIFNYDSHQNSMSDRDNDRLVLYFLTKIPAPTHSHSLELRLDPPLRLIVVRMGKVVL